MPAHFEIHVSDMARAKSFYGEIFGWSFEEMAVGEGVEYFLVTADDIGGDGPLTGALMSRMGNPATAGSPIRGATVTFEVDDCDARYARALELGGAEALPPTDYPGIGRAAYCEDGEGNVVGMITPVQGGN